MKRIILYHEGMIVGGAQVLFKSLPIVGNVGYVTKGPIYDSNQPALVEKVLPQIIHTCQQNNCQLIAIQPPNNGMYVAEQLKLLNFCQSTLELAPTASLVMDLKPGLDIIMKQMSKKTRQHIHSSERSGIVVSEGTQSDLDIFYNCYLVTARRQGFTPYKREYIELLWQNFAPMGWISLMIARYQSKVISTQLLIPFGDTVISKLMGWTGEHDNMRPNEALYYGCIRWAVEHGYRYFDFEGINPHRAREVLSGQTPALSEDTFKYGFGGQVVLYPPAYDFLPNKVYNFAYRLKPPEMEGNSLMSKVVEFVRKR
jgi:lipid II:glycine glycyltransferase (peptidoglycan interpeptide bridge formation enzyme)